MNNQLTSPTDRYLAGLEIVNQVNEQADWRKDPDAPLNTIPKRNSWGSTTFRDTLKPGKDR